MRGVRGQGALGVRYLRQKVREPRWWDHPRCTCPEGLLRVPTEGPLRMGWYCRACLITTLRTEAEIEAFLNAHEGDEGLRQAVLAEMRRQIEAQQLERVEAREMAVLAFP